MDIRELKNLIKKSTSLLVLDNGEPSVVILDYKTYKDLISEKEEKDIKINHNSLRETMSGPVHLANGIHSKESELLDKLNREISALKSQIEMEERGMDGQTIDPSPFER